MTQGRPLAPTIFNLVVDAVLRYWVTVVETLEETPPPVADSMDCFGRDVQRLAAYFYADDGLLASTQANHLQQDFNTLTELFYSVGLHTNVANTVIMECQPCRNLGGHLLEAYGLQMIRGFISFRYHIFQRV